MAAEFDSSGFSAVDKFFGGGTTEREETKKVTTTAGSRGKRRGGVGASTKSSDTKTLSSDLLAKQVLTVGRKRSRDDNNEDEYDGVDDHGVHDADEADEADGGRTSIAPKKTSSKTLDKSQTKPSKKLGRKERERQKQAAKAGGDANKEHPPNSSNAVITETAEEGADVAVNHNNDPNQPKPKKKRRKVRSRQKNIRKDNRSAEEKPAHLIPGNRNYKGRPMTQETREKLNLPPPVKKPFRSKWNNDDNNNKADDDLFVIDRDPDSTGDDLGVKLAIDELMGSDDKGDIEKSASIDDDKPKKKEKKKDSKKKKKKKFKNL